MTIFLSILIFLFLWVPMIDKDTLHPDRACFQASDSALLKRMSRCRIVLKDGTMKKDCRITAIHDHWIEYLKDGSLHDLLIESIRRIEIQDGKMDAVYFDEKNRPRLGAYVY